MTDSIVKIHLINGSGAGLEGLINKVHGAVRAYVRNMNISQDQPYIDISRPTFGGSLRHAQGPSSFNLQLDLEIEPGTTWEISEEPQPQEEEQHGMKERSVAALLVKGMKTVDVRFKNNNHEYGSGRVYTYLTLDEYEVGDFAVVDVHDDGLKVVKIVEVHDVPKVEVNGPYGYQWIVQKLDTSAYEDMNKRMNAFTDDLQRLNQQVIVKQVVECLADDVGQSELDLAVARLNGNDTEEIEHQGVDEDDS